MQLAFCLYKYFPFGGLQRDFLRIATVCHERGHRIRVYTLSWQGDKPNFIDLRIVPVSAWQNHILYRRFQHWIARDLQTHPVDSLIGFNKMPGLDVYYAADMCYIAKIKYPLRWYQRFNARFQQFYRDEKAIFTPHAKTKILLLSQQQKEEFQQFYHTEESRLHILPPGIARDRQRPNDAATIGAALRVELSIPPDDILLLMIGSGFKTKGLDRTLIAVAALPKTMQQRCHLIVIGQDKASAFIRLSQRLHIADRVRILPGRDDIPRFLFAADLLLHPAYRETAGMVLLEALVAGLPVLASDVCGYAHYIATANCGVLIPSPFQQTDFNTAVFNAINDSALRQRWQDNALSYAKAGDLFDLPEHAADEIKKSKS